MLTYLHCYSGDLFEGFEKNGLLRKNFGVRLPHGIFPKHAQFNNIAARGGALYSLVKENRCPLYIDRLQGGCYIYDYPYDMSLLAEYDELLGDDFYGFQMHEWLSNYKADAIMKLSELCADDWNEKNIEAVIRRKYPYENLFLEAMTLSEMAAYGKPCTYRAFYDNMTSIYKNRLARFKKLVPADSYYLMYPFEAENGAKLIMPEVGAQIWDMRLQMSYARGVARAYGIKLGAYYEPWGGTPFSACDFNGSGKNEWHILNEDFPYKTAGENGGSSRSLQWRVHLYAYLSNADVISEEWGGFNTFSNLQTFELSEYGRVKKRFLDFVDKYSDLGDKLAPIAAVVSNELLCYTIKESPNTLFGYELDDGERERMTKLKSDVAKIFSAAEDMRGDAREIKTLINSSVPDAVDMLNEGNGSALLKYDYLVDLTEDSHLKNKYSNCIRADEVTKLLHELLPCKVTGGLHYVVNKRGNGGYYLTVFNHAGVERGVDIGERVIPESKKTVCIETRDGRELCALEGSKDISFSDGKYYVTIGGGDFFFAKF